MSKNGEIVKKYLSKHSKLPDLTLAKLIYSKEKEQYRSIEQIRSLVRSYRGHNGEDKRNKMVKTFQKPLTNNTNAYSWIPQEHNYPPEVWRLPVAYKSVLLVGDIHLPYHSVNAIKACLNWAKGNLIDCIYINGDMLDFYMMSFHEKDMKKRPTTKEELMMGREFLAGLRKEFPNTKIYYKPANHEFRLERYLTLKAPELLDCDEWRLDVLLKLGELGIEYIDRRTKCYFGKLLVEHGDRLKGTGGVSPARTLFLKYKRHAICSHFHKRSEHSAKIYDGNSILTYSIGSLCDLEPEYFEVNEHTNGFANVLVDGEEFRVRNYTIESGKVY